MVKLVVNSLKVVVNYFFAMTVKDIFINEIKTVDRNINSTTIIEIFMKINPTHYRLILNYKREQNLITINLMNSFYNVVKKVENQVLV